MQGASQRCRLESLSTFWKELLALRELRKELSALRALFQLKLFWRLILMVWRVVLRGWDISPPPVDHPPPCWPPPPPCWPPPPTIASTPTALLPPTQCCPPHQPPVHPPVASYWRSQPLAGRLRAIRPTLFGYVIFFSASKRRGLVIHLTDLWWHCLLAKIFRLCFPPEPDSYWQEKMVFLSKSVAII